MATIFAPAPANRSHLSNHLCISLIGGLAALVIGVAVLLAGAVLPAFPSHPVMGSAEAAIRSAAAPGDAGHGVAGMPRSPGHFLSIVDRLPAAHPSPAPPTPHRTAADVGTALGRGTRAESAYLTTIVLNPVGRDVRWDLMEMASAQRHGWAVRCPCPVYPIDVSHSGPR